MAEARVRLGFRNATDGQIVAMADAVLAGMTNNAAFPKPPADLATLRTALDEFNNSIAAQAAGGPAATALKYQRREAVLQLVRKIAHYVEENCNNDLSMLLSSGLTAKSMNRAPSECPKAVILGVKRGRTTELLIKVRAIPNAQVYEVRCAALAEDGTPGPWQESGFFTNWRIIPISGLTPGKMYNVQARAIGGATGYGDWSDPVSHMCI
jgi:hypothetical protein